LQGAQQLAI